MLAAARVPALVKWVPAASVPPSSATSPSTVGLASPSAATAISAAADRPDQRVDGIPQRVQPRDLVGDELDDVEHQRGADHEVVVEDAELLGQRTQPKRWASPRIATVA